MKMGIPQYVESLRFSDACHLLEMTDYTVAKISEESGFGSIRSMNRAFESFLGITPKDYKKKMTDRKD
jgi:transcriptional regulator GlxA family with amidase domain